MDVNNLPQDRNKWRVITAVKDQASCGFNHSEVPARITDHMLIVPQDGYQLVAKEYYYPGLKLGIIVSPKGKKASLVNLESFCKSGAIEITSGTRVKIIRISEINSD